MFFLYIPIQYTQKTKDIATRRVTIINLISVVHLQAESHVARCSQWIVADEWI